MAEASDENPIKPEELQAALRQYVPEQTLARERDVLSGRYRIMTAEPLERFSSAMAKAFVARDTENPTQSLYALIYDANASPRKKNIDALKNFRHPNLVALIAEGVVDIGLYSESRYVVILEQPTGQPLSELLSPKQKNPLPESTVVNHMLRPFIEILKAFSGMGISHNRINLSNVYLSGGSILLGECVSEPSGYSQAFLFEPIDRLLASPMGKPDFAIDADCYATGVVALHLLIGFQPYKNASEEDFIASVLAKGSYHTMVIQWDVTEHIQDLLRALLNNLKRERCTPEHMEFWLAGKSFNLILPSVAQETARPFEFAGQNYFNRKTLAQALYKNWDEARSVLFDTRLQRWLETAIHKKDVADIIGRIASNSVGDTARAEKQNNELLARTIIALDPAGPVRFRNFSFFPEATGSMLAHAYFTGTDDELQDMLHAIESDLAGWWVEQQKGVGDYSVVTSRLQKMRNFLRMRSPGFGIERCIYDWLPSLACQSPLIKRYAVLTLNDVFTALDMVAVNQRATETDFMDVHIAGFVANRLDMAKEIRLHELEAIRELNGNPRLLALKILGRAQHSIRYPHVKGLTYWIVLRLFNLPDHIHRRSMRHQMQRLMQEAATTGLIERVTSVLFNPDMFVNDYQGFKKAEMAYAQRNHQIKRLQDPRERARHARMVGRGLAQTLAYGTCLFTIYFTLRSYYHF